MGAPPAPAESGLESVSSLLQPRLAGGRGGAQALFLGPQRACRPRPAGTSEEKTRRILSAGAQHSSSGLGGSRGCVYTGLRTPPIQTAQREPLGFKPLSQLLGRRQSRQGTGHARNWDATPPEHSPSEPWRQPVARGPWAPRRHERRFQVRLLPLPGVRSQAQVTALFSTQRNTSNNRIKHSVYTAGFDQNETPWPFSQRQPFFF